jgi:hypothetical protein
MRRPFGVHWALVTAVAVLACEQREIVDGVCDSTFVATLADLQRVRANPLLDSAARDSARRAVLQGRGLTAAQMDRAALALADHPERARELLQAVRVRLMPGADSAGAGNADGDVRGGSPDR